MATRSRRGVSTIFAITLVAASYATPAAARPDPGPQRTPTPSVHRPPHCPLERIGTQFVRCDDLTGAGVPAPAWIPEYGSTVGAMEATTTLPSGS